MTRVGIVANVRKQSARSVVSGLVEWLRGAGAEVFLAQDLAGWGAGAVAASDEQIGRQSDFVVAIGGDGTLLEAVRRVGRGGKPFLGVNIGSLGFLMQVKREELYSTMEKVLAGECPVEERMMLEVRPAGAENSSYALNDAVVDRGGSPRVVELSTYVNGAYLNTLVADGIIVSTPTGSTAYSLSAGGPIVTPTMRCIVATPVCPHTLAARPVVIGQDETLSVEPTSDSQGAMLTIDGQSQRALEPGQIVEFKRAPTSVRLITSPSRCFYDVLRAKLKWGERDQLGGEPRSRQPNLTSF